MNFKIGVEIDVMSVIIVLGLMVYEGIDYDIIIYFVMVGIGFFILFEEGGYYVKMFDGFNIWYLDVFVMFFCVD